MRHLLSVRTVYPRPGSRVWYDDQRDVHRQIFEGVDAVDYAFMGTNPDVAENRWLREAFEQQVRADRSLRADGNPGFAIHPSAPRSEYFVADFLWPLQGNEALLGFDISSQPANLEAMHYARDTGQVVMLAPFTLLQETPAHPGPGIVIRVPVFDAMRAEGDPAAGRNFLGAVAMTVETEEHALARGARIYCELAGFGMSADANHITAPCDDGEGLSLIHI